MTSPKAMTDSMTADKPAMIENIQALRGIAALCVVWAHLKFVIKPLDPSTAMQGPIETAYGAIGVDIFFVISGYVICLTACKRHHSPVDFFFARVARVSPVYLAMFLPAIFYIPGKYVTWHLVSARSIWNQLFYLPIFDWHAYTSPTLSVGWTLSFEMWFYLVFALLLNFWKPARVALILPAFFLVGAGLMTAFYRGAWYFPLFMFHPFVLEFALGCLVFHTQRFVTARPAWVLLVGGFLFMLIFSTHAGRLGWHPMLLNDRLDLAWLRVFDWGVPAALIAAGLVGLERHRGYVLPRAFVALGTISYSLYLTHLFVVTTLARYGALIHLHNEFLIIVLMPTLSIVVAWLCWKWIEKPLTTRAQAWAKKTTRSLNSGKESATALPAATAV